jgi:antirestriction protein ArdC
MKALYETVTNQIIEELKVGAIPWTQPWMDRAFSARQARDIHGRKQGKRSRQLPASVF